jgi:hypothetical protein
MWYSPTYSTSTFVLSTWAGWLACRLPGFDREKALTCRGQSSRCLRQVAETPISNKGTFYFDIRDLL